MQPVTMELINIGLGFEEEVMKRTLIDKLGVRRYLQVTKEAMVRGTVPEDRDDRTFAWLKEETVLSIGKEIPERMENPDRVPEWKSLEHLGSFLKRQEEFRFKNVEVRQMWIHGRPAGVLGICYLWRNTLYKWKLLRKEKILGRLRSQSKTVRMNPRERRCVRALRT